MKWTRLIALAALITFSSMASNFNDTLKLAKQGGARAQHNLGVMYDKAEGIPQDYKQAFKWYTKAAEQGDVDAQHNLGTMYGYGQGTHQNYKQAAKWYTKAADKGDAGAQYNLAIIYGKGLGTPQNYKKAYIWFSISASSGHEEAIKGRYTLAKVMTPKKLEEAQEEANIIYNEITR